MGDQRNGELPPGNIFAAELRQLSELARKMGGQLVSTKYLGSEKHEWKCGIAEHSSWLTEPWRIRLAKPNKHFAVAFAGTFSVPRMCRHKA